MDPDELEDHEVSRLNYRGNLATYSKRSGWALCIGAGASSPFFPDWNELASSLFHKTSGPRFKKVDVESFVKTYGAAPAIQAAAEFHQSAEKLHGESSPFPDLVSESLYEGLKRDVESLPGPWKWELLESKALSSASPRTFPSPKTWKVFVDRLETVANRPKNKNHASSAFGIAEAVAEVADTERRPQAILSFNAETLLFALINAFYAQGKNSKAYSLSGHRPVVRMVHELSQRQSGQIPFFHIHGLVPIPGQTNAFERSISNEKLIFSEGQYLSLSNRAYSWQSTNFLSICLNHRCVFAGVSFTDPNLRRWLAWQQESRIQERRSKKLREHRYQHFWFKKHSNAGRGKLTNEQKLIQASVDHLGVRVIWIKDYPEIGERLKEMLEPS
ncbi:MAG: SIR2 family protein [Verrucomicrobiales bacterium]